MEALVEHELPGEYLEDSRRAAELFRVVTEGRDTVVGTSRHAENLRKAVRGFWPTLLLRGDSMAAFLTTIKATDRPGVSYLDDEYRRMLRILHIIDEDDRTVVVYTE